MVLWKACYNNLEGGLQRKGFMARLHVYPDEEVPEDIMCNVTGHIRQVKRVPKSMEEHSEQEVEDFPRIWNPPDNYIQK